MRCPDVMLYLVFATLSTFLISAESAQAQSSWSTFEQIHPLRAQVLSSDKALNNEIKQDYVQLGGNYSQLENAANKIWEQEQAYARQNGGYITRSQWVQLDSEEAALQNAINNDYSVSGQGSSQDNPWPDYNTGSALTPPPVVQTPSSGLLSILGGYTRQACGWSGNSGFSPAGSTSRLIPALPPTSTSSVDINVAY